MSGANIPTYDCNNNSDKFTVSTSTGNGKLIYPIALMTADEIKFAGGLVLMMQPHGIIIIVQN